MRDLVRAQLDLDDTDLPDVLLDNYVQEGYDRVLELESRWPFFESQWTLDVGADGAALMPSDARMIEMLLNSGGRLMRRIPPRLSVMSFPPGQTNGTGSPLYWSRLNRQIFVRPAPGAITALTVFGYREGSDWISAAGAECDCDRRLHIPICWYACSLGYAQQEDEVLEATYLNRFKEGAAIARDAIMKPNSTQPKQVGYTHYPTAVGGPGGPTQLVIAPPGPTVEKDTIIGGTP
jgi:hypothetical protein